MRYMVRCIFVIALLSMLIFVITGAVIISFGTRSKPVKSDCIIILGCQVYGTVPSPFLMARLDEGLRLYKEGYSRYVIVSGAKGPGEEVTEAQAMKDYLVSKGGDPSAIILEDKSVSTAQNIKFSKIKMDEMGFKSAVIVSNKYHLRRASLMAKKSGIISSCSGVFVEKYKAHEVKGFLREVLALLKYLLLG